MLLFYLVACLPVIVGAVLWVFSKKIVWWEWAISVVLSFAVAGLTHVAVIHGLTADQETWSGQIIKAVYHPKWVETYQHAVYKSESYTTTTGFGKNRRTVTRTRRVFSHYETRYRTHNRHWVAHNSLGQKRNTKSISEAFYNEIMAKWGGPSCKKTVKGSRPGYYSGDKNDYVLTQKTDYIFPVVETYTFENRIKAAPSVFSFVKVPESVKVFTYPRNPSWRCSGRLLGDARKSITIVEWDQMNSRLGPRKKVNVILIGFGAKDSSIAHMQEAKWIGGKKNDLVLCYGGNKEKVEWAYVFGWTEKEIVKRNLETIMIGDRIDSKLIGKIEKEILKNYTIKEWEKFDYISVEPPYWAYLILLGVLCFTQTIFFLVSYFNNSTK